MDDKGALEGEESTRWVSIGKIDDSFLLCLVEQHPGVSASKVSGMSGGGESSGDLCLHPGKPVADGVVWCYLMHQVDGFFLEDPCSVVHTVVHVGNEEMRQV